MKKQLFTFVFLALFAHVYCQNWQPLTRSDIFHFKHKDSPFITQSVWVNNFTATNQGDTTFYLNLIANHFLNPLSPTSPNYQCMEGLAYHLPHFLQKEAVKQADSTWVFQSPTMSYFFKPFAQLNDSWLFEANNNVTATVVAIDTLQLIGQSDSVKKIFLSTGDSIFLSKNFGLLRFPTFDSTLYVEWAGIQTRSLGDTIFHYKEIFDFEVGDVFYYNAYMGMGGGTGFPGSFYTNIYQKIKATVTNKVSSLNNLQYDFHCNIQTKIGQTGPYTFSVIDTTLFFYAGNTRAYNSYPRQYTTAWGGYALLEWDSTFSCLSKSFPYGFIHPVVGMGADTIWGGNCFESVLKSSMKYGKGLGLLHSRQFNFSFGPNLMGSQSDTSLVGYIKNGISVGTIYPDWQFTGVEKGNISHLYFSPNPVKDELYFWVEGENDLHSLRIWDMQGQEMIAETPLLNSTTHILRVQDWAKGLYFVEIRDKEGNVYTEKFVKE